MQMDTTTAAASPDSVNYSYNYSVWVGTTTTASAMSEMDVALNLVYYGFPVIIIMGVVGNILSLCVLLRPRMRYTSVNVYLVALAVADTCVLLTSATRTWLRAVSGLKLLHTSSFTCKGFMFLFLLSIHLSAWLVVAVSFDRWVVVWLPFRSLTHCSLRRALIVTFSTFVILVLYNMHSWWTIGLRGRMGSRFCGSSRKNAFMTNVFPWLRLYSYSCVPFLCVAMLNLGIIIRISRSRSLTATNERGSPLHACSRSSNQRDKSLSASQRKVTIMLLFVSFAFLCLTAPFTLWNFVYSSASSRNSPTAFLAKTICFCLLYTNHGINFYIYCITGMKFRVELRLFIRSLRLCGRNRRRESRLSLRTGRTGLARTDSAHLRLQNNNDNAGTSAPNDDTSLVGTGKRTGKKRAVFTTRSHSSSSDKKERSSTDAPHGMRNAHCEPRDAFYGPLTSRATAV